MPDAKARASRILQLFNLTIPEWDAISVYQSDSCAICGRKSLPGKHLSTDHCHKTGLIRGLLCNICNRLLGKIERQWPDIRRLIMRALNYVEDPPACKALNKRVFTFAGRVGTKRHRAAIKKSKKDAAKRARV